MNRKEAIVYKEHLKGMTKRELIKNSMELKRRLDKLSGVCDIEDTYKAIIEQEQSERKSEKLNKQVIESTTLIKKELYKRGVHYEPWFTLTKLTKTLIDSINQ